MVYKLLIVMLALLVLETSTQRLNSLRDLYKYDFMNYQEKRQRTGYLGDVTTPKSPCVGRSCNLITRTPNPIDRYPKQKRVWAKLDLMNLLQDLPREEISESVIFVPEEYEYDQKTE